jgi:SPP1 gp7 family putative phage head morphogenesis protein
MPYPSAADVPSYVPQAKRKQWAHVWNSAYARAKKEGKGDKEAEASAFRQANSVAGPSSEKKFAKLMAKITMQEAQAFSDALIAQLKRDFEDLPTGVRAPLASAMLSGVGQGMLQIDVSNAALLAEANTVAQDYATERAAELVGMTYDVNGNLVANPNAKWAISDTTRDRIREIIFEAFGEETPLRELRDEIAAALEEEGADGIFSEMRADLIARTEVKNAQSRGNYSVWEKSNLVKSVQWMTSEDPEVCPECDGNDGVIVEMGQPFPSGDLYPGVHPRCRCSLVVHEVKEPA